LVAVCLAVPAVRGDAGRRALVAAAAVMAAGALTHLVPVLALSGLLVCYAVAVAATRSRSVRTAAGSAGFVLGGATLITVAAMLAAGGDLGLQGASGHGYRLARGGYDPTALLAGLKRKPIPKSQHRFYTPPTTIATDFFTAATQFSARGGPLLAGLLLLAALAAALGGWQERASAAAAGGMALMLVLVALLFSFRYSYYIQATFGERRLFDYALLPMILLAAAGLNTLIGHLARVNPRLPPFGAVALALAAVLAFGDHGLRGGLGDVPVNSYITAARVATPCNSRIVTPFISRGSFQAFTGRANVREGLMVFLRPDILNQALRINSEANSFYADPVGQADFLRRQGIDYVLAPKRLAESLDATPNLLRTAHVGNVVVYRVTGALSGDFARPSDAPGYSCARP
jgi:hypothetical protein